jgi:hypothetical protein
VCGAAAKSPGAALGYSRRCAWWQGVSHYECGRRPLYLRKGAKFCGVAITATVFIVGFMPSKGHSFQIMGSDGGFLAIADKKVSFTGKENFWLVLSVTGKAR